LTHSRFLLLAFSILILATIYPLTVAQQVNATADEKKAEQVLRDKAFRLLESVASQLGTMQSAENRARIGSNLVDSLWKHDEQRARNLLPLVEQDIRAGLADWDAGGRNDQNTLGAFLLLRRETIERVAKYDAELAFAFLEATEFTTSKELHYGIQASERQFKTSLAKKLANSSKPELALKIARQALASGLGDDVLSLLSQLLRKHRETGVIFYKEIVATLRSADLLHDWNARHILRRLIEGFPPSNVDDSSFRELGNLVMSTALTNGCDKKPWAEMKLYLCQELAGIELSMKRFDRRAGTITRGSSENPEAEWPLEGHYEVNDVVQSGTVDELLELATKYPHLQNTIYWQAVIKSVAVPDMEQARKIANKGDSQSRQEMLNYIERQQRSNARTSEQLGDLEKTLEGRPIEKQLEILVWTANRIGASDRNGALRLLNRSRQLVESMTPGGIQTKFELALAMMYCLEKSDRGFEIMETLMPKLNGLIEAATKLDGFDTHYIRDGEWNMSNQGSIGSLLTTMAHKAGYFAWCDFDRAVTMTAQFDRAEIRLMAQLKLAQSVLAGPPKRLM
jgi:hypothetical protein